MKPRQTVKNYSNPNVPPYQQPNSSNSPMLGDIDLTKLGSNLEDLSNLTNQEDIVKCLQSIYSKSSAELLQKMPLLNDWPMQSVSPSDYSGLGSSSNANNNNVACSSNSGVGIGDSSSNVIVGTSGLGLNNNNNNINSSNLVGQQKQDLQFTNSQHPQQPSAINHFRIPTSSVHSPQQLLSQQQKSVLSLHQQHQNDLSNRRLNHHHMSTTNTSFANLSAVNASNATSTSTITSDTNNLTALSSNIIGNKNSCSSGVTPYSVANIMDTLGSMDNMYFDGSLQVNKDAPTNQQSLIRHQQLQKLLKTTGSQLKPSSSSNTTLLHRNDLQPQRNINSSNIPQSPHQISSPATMPPQQTAFSSVPKSLLNLAACSSSSPTPASTPTLPSPSKFSSMVSQLNLRSARNASASGQTNLNKSGINSNNSSTTGSRTRINSGNTPSSIMTGSSNNNIDAFTIKSSNYGNDQNNMLQQLVRSATSTPSQANLGLSIRSSAKSIPLSLLSDDQSSTNRTNLRGHSNVQPGPNSKTPSHISTQALNIRDMYQDIVANFQKTCDRETRAGSISIGEINKTVQTGNLQSVNDSISSVTNQFPQNVTTISISPTQSKGEFMKSVDNKEIESALSRVEARNDLSLLYPPLLLATNSQKQINALSAGLQGTKESEMFTKEVKRIVLEECNIIYECKECNNLFRSLANLVKHKRTYCLEQSGVEMNKRSIVNSVLSMDQPTISITSSPATIAGDTNQDVVQEDNSTIDEPGLIANSYNSRGTDRRQNLANDLRMLRIIRNQERKVNQEREAARKTGQVNGANSGTPATQTSLSKLLQSQPKNRLPSSRDSALIGALNMAPISTTIISTTNPLSAFEIDKNISCSSSDVHEQLVRNSSLAKTLLNEKVKSINPRQSLIELSKAESIQPSTTKRVAPKRKFLEDCIQKVKRDKLFTGEDETRIQLTPITSNSNAAIVKTPNLQMVGRRTINSELGGIDLMNSPGDSDHESDMLTIDLDEPKKRIPMKKSKRQINTIASSSESSSSSMRLNTSSALLKALTRPIDSKRPYNASLLSFDRQTQNNVQDISNEKVSAEENVAETEVLSPLFEKHTCDICDTDFVDLASLMNHTNEKHKEEKMLYPCIFCSFSFIALENVCRHIIDIHKKPKSQVHRLKEVVRSRSYTSSDFLACSDYPSKVEEKDLNLKDITDEPTDIDQSKSCKEFEGMRTRGKKRVDYNQMVNNDVIDDAEVLSSRTRKSRSKSADQTPPQIEKAQDNLHEKAASVGGNPMDLDCEDTLAQDIATGQDIIPGRKVDEGQQIIGDLQNSLQRGEINSEKSTESSEVVEIGDTENNMKPSIGDGPKEAAVLFEENEVINEEFEPSLSGYNEDAGDEEEAEVEYDESAGADDAEEEEETEHTEQCESDGSDASSDSSSSSGSDSSSNSTSSTSSSSSSGSSSSSDSSFSSGTDAKDSSQELTSDSAPQQTSVVDGEVEQSSSRDSKIHEVTRPPSLGKHILPAKESKSQQSGPDHRISPYPCNDSDSEPCEASEDGGEDYDSTPPNEPDKREQTPESARQSTQRPPSSSKTTSETTPSSNSAGGGSGGIMKLKIQLKTRPDEKSKVYEIV